MTAGFSVCLEGVNDLISAMQNLDTAEVYGQAATDAAEIAAASIQGYAQRAGVPDEVVEGITTKVNPQGIIGVTSTHPDHDRYEMGDLDTPPTGFWGSALADNDQYEPHFGTLLAAHIDARLL